MRILLTILSVFLSTSTFAQKKLIQKLLSTEQDTSRNASFLPVPVLSYSQETGLEFGVGAIYSFYFDKNDPKNRSTNVFTNVSYSTKGIYNFMVKGDAWTKGNDLHLIGDLRLRKNLFDFYGLGNQTLELDKDALIQNTFKLGLEVERLIAPHLYVGVSASGEHHKFRDKIEDGIFYQNQYQSKSGGFVGTIGLSQSFDTRNSSNYTTKGVYSRIQLQYSPNIDSKTNFSGLLTRVNVRGFIPATKKLTVGIQGIYHGVSGTNTPFFLLPQLGNDEMMRGYYTGRYRDKNLLTFQTEVRFRYNARFGAAIFGGTGTVFGEEKFNTKDFKPNYGAGLRYFFDPEKGLSLRLDYGVGEKRTGEARQSGFYIALSEAF